MTERSEEIGGMVFTVTPDGGGLVTASTVAVPTRERVPW